jgi:hypothetical protein
LVGAIAQWTNPRVSLLVGAVATVLSAGLLMWRHQARLVRSGRAAEAEARMAEARAVDEVASDAA